MSDDVAAAYTRHLRARGLAPGTVRLRVHQLGRIRTLVPDLLGADEDRLVRVLDGLYDTHTAESRKSIRSALRSFYSWAHRAGLIESDPAAYLPPVRVPHSLPRVAPDEVIVAALESATLHQRYMLLAGRYACLRLSELSGLHPRDRTGERLRILGKGGKQRIVFAHPDLLAVLLELEALQGVGAYYLPGRSGGHAHHQAVHKIIKRVTGWNPHSLRHAGATAAYTATHDLRAVQLMLGHSSIATTERYLTLGDEALRAVGHATTLAAAS